jgi:hypothetical protein
MEDIIKKFNIIDRGNDKKAFQQWVSGKNIKTIDDGSLSRDVVESNANNLVVNSVLQDLSTKEIDDLIQKLSQVNESFDGWLLTKRVQQQAQRKTAEITEKQKQAQEKLNAELKIAQKEKAQLCFVEWKAKKTISEQQRVLRELKLKEKKQEQLAKAKARNDAKLREWELAHRAKKNTTQFRNPKPWVDILPEQSQATAKQLVAPKTDARKPKMNSKSVKMLKKKADTEFLSPPLLFSEPQKYASMCPRYCSRYPFLVASAK